MRWLILLIIFIVLHHHGNHHNNQQVNNSFPTSWKTMSFVYVIFSDTFSVFQFGRNRTPLTAFNPQSSNIYFCLNAWYLMPHLTIGAPLGQSTTSITSITPSKTTSTISSTTPLTKSTIRPSRLESCESTFFWTRTRKKLNFWTLTITFMSIVFFSKLTKYLYGKERDRKNMITWIIDMKIIDK